MPYSLDLDPLSVTLSTVVESANALSHPNRSPVSCPFSSACLRSAFDDTMMNKDDWSSLQDTDSGSPIMPTHTGAGGVCSQSTYAPVRARIWDALLKSKSVAALCTVMPRPRESHKDSSPPLSSVSELAWHCCSGAQDDTTSIAEQTATNGTTPNRLLCALMAARVG